MQDDSSEESGVSASLNDRDSDSSVEIPEDRELLARGCDDDES